jgi:hypothetical protein
VRFCDSGFAAGVSYSSLSRIVSGHARSCTHPLQKEAPRRVAHGRLIVLFPEACVARCDSLEEREHCPGECRMLWIVTAVSVAVGIVALLAVIFSKRSDYVDELGAVSSRWIAEHHVDSH